MSPWLYLYYWLTHSWSPHAPAFRITVTHLLNNNLIYIISLNLLFYLSVYLRRQRFLWITKQKTCWTDADCKTYKRELNRRTWLYGCQFPGSLGRCNSTTLTLIVLRLIFCLSETELFGVGKILACLSGFSTSLLSERLEKNGYALKQAFGLWIIGHIWNCCQQPLLFKFHWTCLEFLGSGGSGALKHFLVMCTMSKFNCPLGDFIKVCVWWHKYITGKCNLFPLSGSSFVFVGLFR